MAHAPCTDLEPVEVNASPDAAEEPLEIQNLWPITTDLVDAATRVAQAVHGIAHVLAEDTDAAAVSLRQQLLEIRARLVYAYSEIRSTIISDTSGIISLTVYTAGAILRNEASSSGTAGLERMVAAIISGCSANRTLLEETQPEWHAFHASLSQLSSVRSRSSQSGVASFLRNFGAFASTSASSHANFQQSFGSPLVSGVSDDLRGMIQSLERIEAFWRKRAGLFSGSGYSFGRESLARFYESFQQLDDAYLKFLEPLFQNEQDLSHSRPPIMHTPRSFSDSVKLQLSWRALIQP